MLIFIRKKTNSSINERNKSEKQKIIMDIKITLEMLDPLVRYCRDNNISRPVCEMDTVRGNKVWVCCRSGSYSGTAIGDTYENALSKAIEKFVANFPFPFKNN